jgi:hypothetical protein
MEQDTGAHPHLIAIAPGKEPEPLVNTAEATNSPFTTVGSGEIAFLVGPDPQRTIAVASISNGRISRRIPFDHGDIRALAASPDGKTIYCSANGMVWSIPSTGDPVKLRAGDFLAVDPGGKSLIVEVIGAPVNRFFRVPLDGSQEQEIPRAGDGRAASGIIDRAVAPDGRIVTPLGSSTFNWPLGIIDPRTGIYSEVPADRSLDYHAALWTPDGHILAIGLGMQSTLWKFTPVN